MKTRPFVVPPQPFYFLRNKSVHAAQTCMNNKSMFSPSLTLADSVRWPKSHDFLLLFVGRRKFEVSGGSVFHTYNSNGISATAFIGVVVLIR